MRRRSVKTRREPQSSPPMHRLIAIVTRSLQSADIVKAATINHLSDSSRPFPKTLFTSCIQDSADGQRKSKHFARRIATAEH
jgi:hypothetical protein